MSNFHPLEVMGRGGKLWVAVARHNFNPLAAKLFNWNFHPLEVVIRWRDPQLQVTKNYLYFNSVYSVYKIQY